MNHLQRLHDLSLCLNNRDDITIAQTVRNLEEGKPAYWYRGRTSGATWVVDLSHVHGSFLKALEVFIERKPNLRIIEDVLDNVIPLNASAVNELALCYRLQSTFRDDLADRERRAIFDPEYFPGMSDEMMFTVSRPPSIRMTFSTCLAATVSTKALARNPCGVYSRHIRPSMMPETHMAQM